MIHRLVRNVTIIVAIKAHNVKIKQTSGCNVIFMETLPLDRAYWWSVCTLETSLTNWLNKIIEGFSTEVENKSGICPEGKCQTTHQLDSLALSSALTFAESGDNGGSQQQTGDQNAHKYRATRWGWWWWREWRLQICHSQLQTQKWIMPMRRLKSYGGLSEKHTQQGKSVDNCKRHIQYC